MEKGIWRGQKRSHLSTWTSLQVTGSYTMEDVLKLSLSAVCMSVVTLCYGSVIFFLAEKGGRPVSQVEEI